MKISKRTIKHSSHGTFKYVERKPVKMLSGGHGQNNIDYLKRNKVNYFIVHQYDNGVRLGNVSIHKRKVCRENGKQCWFPKNWTEKDMENAAKHILSLKKNQGLDPSTPKTGYYKGVKVGLYDKDGKVTTIFPWYNQRRK